MQLFSTSLFLAALLVLVPSGPARAAYPAIFDQQVKEFPNIVTQSEKCLGGHKATLAQSTRVCDPTGVLSDDEYMRVNQALDELNAPYPGVGASCPTYKPLPQAAVAVVPRISVPQNPGFKRMLQFSSIFNYYLFDDWDLKDGCNGKSKIVIFYSKADGVVYATVGPNLADRLPPKTINRIATMSSGAFANGAGDGLIYIIKKFKEVIFGGGI